MMHTLPIRRRGLTLLEIMLAIIVLTAVAAATLGYVRQPSDRVKGAACNLRSQQLDVLARQYEADYGRLPSSNLAQLIAPRYLGERLPLCPVDGRTYVLDHSTGRVVPHNHP